MKNGSEKAITLPSGEVIEPGGDVSPASCVGINAGATRRLVAQNVFVTAPKKTKAKKTDEVIEVLVDDLTEDNPTE